MTDVTRTNLNSSYYCAVVVFVVVVLVFFWGERIVLSSILHTFKRCFPSCFTEYSVFELI